MKTHIDASHAHLIAKRKLKLIVIVETKYSDINHNQQLGKIKARLSRSIITTFCLDKSLQGW
jgi:hypothetical protein